MPDTVTISKVEFDTLMEKIKFHEDRLRILRKIVRIHRALPRGIRARLRILREVRQILETGTDPGEG